MPGGRAVSADLMQSRRGRLLNSVGIAGALVGYGCLAAFLWLISVQVYDWFRDGEWTHVGIGDGLRAVLSLCGVKDGDSGRLAALLHWLDAPVTWLGLHEVFEVMPASLALFSLSILGNSIFVYCRDRLEEHQRQT